MAVGLKYINKNFFDDDFSKTLNHKEKLILIHLFFIQGNGGIVKINLGSIEQALNSTSIIEKLDNDEEIDDSEYISKKDCRKTIKFLIDNKKLVKMKDGFYLFVNYFKNQNIQNQSIFLGVINNLQEVMLKNDWMLEFMKQENQYFGQLGLLVYEHLTAKPKKSNKEQESTAYKFRLKTKYLDFCDSFQLSYNQEVSRWGTPVKDLSDTCLTEEQHLSDTQGDTCRGNININSNVNINSNTNANKKHSIRMNNIKNKSQTNIESNKILSLGGQNFIDSQDGSQEPSREGLSERANAVISSRVISDYFRKAFKKFEMDVDPVVGSNIIEIEVKSYKTHKELETDARELVEYLVSSETIKEVTTVQEFPKMLKWYRSKIAPKLRDKLKDDKLYQSEEKVAQN